MRVLIVGSINRHAGKFAPFIVEQAESLQSCGCEVEYFGLVGKGIMGYIRNIPRLRSAIRHFHPDVIHAHYGLCGLVANVQRRVPVITTYHGSDINQPQVLHLSKISMWLSSWNIFVSQRTMTIAHGERLKRASLIPCGINLPPCANELPNMSHVMEHGKKHVLFAGAFDNAVKDLNLAKQVIAVLNQQFNTPTQLIELKGYSRDEVSSLMYACDAFLMTSKTEGSPQVIKEAMACGCPIVSVDVGDVRERIMGLDGCYVVDGREPQELAGLLQQAMSFGKTTGYDKIIADHLDNAQIAQRLMDIYTNIVK